MPEGRASPPEVASLLDGRTVFQSARPRCAPVKQTCKGCALGACLAFLLVVLGSWRRSPLTSDSGVLQLFDGYSSSLAALTVGRSRQAMPSLFCVTLMRPSTYEAALLREQVRRGRAGIFGCDSFAVYSNESEDLSGGGLQVRTDVMPGSLAASNVSDLDTDIFFRFWDKVVGDARAWRHDWTVRADPDVVFFPKRLRRMLRGEWPLLGRTSAAAYLYHCYKSAVPLYSGNHGPIEVLTYQALAAYKEGRWACVGQARGRGSSSRRCFDTVGLERVDAFGLLNENDWACAAENASDVGGDGDCRSEQVAFHPFKTVKTYFACYSEGHD